MGGISVWQLLILLVIVLVIFGTKRLRNAGSDLGGAIKGFREGMAGKEGNEDGEKPSEQLEADKLDSADSVQERTAADPKDDK